MGSGSMQRRALQALTDIDVRSGSKPEVASGTSLHEQDEAFATVDFEDDGMPNPDGSLSPSAGGVSGGVTHRRRRERIQLTLLQKSERAYQRSMAAMVAGARALVGARAELVLGFCGPNTRYALWRRHGVGLTTERMLWVGVPLLTPVHPAMHPPLPQC